MSSYNTIRISDKDFDQTNPAPQYQSVFVPNNSIQNRSPSPLVPVARDGNNLNSDFGVFGNRSNFQPEIQQQNQNRSSFQQGRDNLSDNDFTQYTANSLEDDNFDLNSQAQVLLDYNSFMIQGFQDFINKDSNGLIESYSNALAILETQAKGQTENIINLRCNLGISHFFNKEVQDGIRQVESALQLLNETSRKAQKSVFSNDDRILGIENQSFERQTLYLKCQCNLMVMKFSIGDESGYKKILFEITGFLKSM